MDVKDVATAREFADAWQGYGSRGVWMMRHAADSQRSIAAIESLYGRRMAEQRHLKAAAELDRRAQRLEREGRR